MGNKGITVVSPSTEVFQLTGQALATVFLEQAVRRRVTSQSGSSPTSTAT